MEAEKSSEEIITTAKYKIEYFRADMEEGK